MSLVLRCPSCGTTQLAAGECEACHDARVRYFCTNHTPGLWVDAPTCPQCAARFGESIRPLPARLPPPPVRTRPAETVRSPTPTPGRAPAAPSMTVIPLWQQLLGAAIRARAMSTTAPGRARAPIASPLGGCLMRLALIAVLLFVALVIAMFVFGRAMFQGLQPY